MIFPLIDIVVDFSKSGYTIEILELIEKVAPTFMYFLRRYIKIEIWRWIWNLGKS